MQTASKLFLVLALLTSLLATLAAWLLPARDIDALLLPPGSALSSDQAKLIEARARTLRSAAIVVVKDGREVLAWGDVDALFDVRSIRKSVLSLVIGQLVKEAELDLGASLASLDIDDSHFTLNPAERAATVQQLMESRSGIYHPAARETRSAARYRPPRGAHAPGEFWYYNNWDFNALESIAASAAGSADYCQVFFERIGPLLEGVAPQCRRRHEPGLSEHAAHVIRMSARQLADIATLFLNDGIREGKSLLPTDWVNWSTAPVSDFHFIETSKMNYGRLFWSIDPYGPMTAQSYMMRGAGSQYVWVIPEHRMVIVHLVRTTPLGLRQRLSLIPDDNDAWQFGGQIASLLLTGRFEAPRLY